MFLVLCVHRFLHLPIQFSSYSVLHLAPDVSGGKIGTCLTNKSLLSVELLEICISTQLP